MNTDTSHATVVEPKKPNHALWLIAACVSTLLALVPSIFVYSQWQNINEFTLLVTMIPALIALLLWGLALSLWVVWSVQLVRLRKFRMHQQVISGIMKNIHNRSHLSNPQ